MFGQNAQRTGQGGFGEPKINNQPIDSAAEKGGTHNITVFAYGSYPLNYKWEFNGKPIQGATLPSLTIENATSKDSGLYRVTITNKHGSVTSNEAVLKVVTPGAPQIFADGKEVIGSVVKGDKAEITLSTSFEGGAIFYTLDSSEPSFETSLYDEPFTVSKTAGVRAIAYKGDFTDLAEADPVFINIVPNYNLNVSVEGQGTVIKDPTDGPYMQDSVVKLKAVPGEGWRFKGWSGALTSSFEEGSVVMGSDKSVTAKFEQIPKYKLNLSLSNYSEHLESNINEDSNPWIKTNKSSYLSGETINVSFGNGPGNSKDWVGLYRPDVTPGDVGSLVWAYVSGTTTAGEGLTEGVITFAGGLPAGSYVALFPSQ